MVEEITMGKNAYVRTINKTSWFFRQPRYMYYMLREVTSLFIGAYTLLLIIVLRQITEGPEAFQIFLEWLLYHPLMITFNVITLIASIYHSITWFNVTPQALRIQWGVTIVSGKIIISIHYLLWIILSITLLAIGI